MSCDNEHWTITSVGTIVRNRVYLGEARAGKIVNPEPYEPIVTLVEWQAANKRRGASIPADRATERVCSQASPAVYAATR